MLFELYRTGDGVREPPDTILKFSDSFDDFGSRDLRSDIFVELNFAFAFFNVLADSRPVIVDRTIRGNKCFRALSSGISEL